MKERFHKQSRLTVPALCQSRITARAASFNFNKPNLFLFVIVLTDTYITEKWGFDVQIQLFYK